MLTVRIKRTGGAPMYWLAGAFDEKSNFSDLFGNTLRLMMVNAKDFDRINSIGFKIWRCYLQKVRSEGGVFSFVEISPTLVAIMNYLINFVMPFDEVPEEYFNFVGLTL